MRVARAGLVAVILASLGGAEASPERGRTSAPASAELSRLSKSVGGMVGIAAIHVESGRAVEANGRRPLPLYSVFKLPLAVVILKDVEDGRMRLDQKLRITPAEVVPGSAENATLWPGGSVERTIRELLELSIVRSDNTSADKLLEMAGGPGAVTRRLAALGIPGITIRRSVREFFALRGKPHPNTASALDLARLLARLQKGEILGPESRSALLGFMGSATTGLHRIRGGVPEGTPVADKTGSGPGGSASNDVGIVTLPGGQGHLAVAVLVSGSKKPVAAQEKLIADVARALYDANVAPR